MRKGLEPFAFIPKAPLFRVIHLTTKDCGNPFLTYSSATISV